ncbi:MAG: GFA family protein [Methyloceanibacter sp.]|uniref:GFA family protein n=1 Tax=Methyloceanibacter sp. TaxID=1965321 RepID=UPI003EE084B0
MASSGTITGGCLCGAIRYRIEAEPRATRACWCRTCQYLGAGNATVNVFFPSEAIVVEGEIKEYASRADRGDMVTHAFCPVCGTPVFTQSETRRQVKGVRAGTLDNPELGKPQKILWTLEAPRWAPFDPAVPREERQ